MPGYELNRLDSRNFQHLVQALALRVLGPEARIYGDGPDGARDATFQMSLTVTDPNAVWDGYGIIQIKFRQTSRRGAKDVTWLCSELRKEMKKFAKREKLTKPKYYIIATNLYLSSVAEKGGKDLVDKVLQEHGTVQGVQDWRIWDGDQIERFLDGHPDIRQTYAAWVLSGDVLTEVMNKLHFSTPKFQSIMKRFLQQELLADQYPRLHGNSTSDRDRIPLARVFIDLPASAEPISEARYTGPQDNISFLCHLLDVGVQRLDPRNLKVTARKSTDRGADRVCQTGRLVLVGGPGQGKTTLGQFACQLYRAALLEKNQAKYTAEVESALKSILDQSKTGSIPLPKSRRFPVRVVLNEFAAALGKDEHCDSLLSYIRLKIQKRTDSKISHEDLRNWLSSYPWFLVLDGLDEVPASSNRDAVLEAVSNFLIEVNELDADLLILATTRPQGYHQEFPPNVHEHWYLVPLDPAIARRYASMLIAERHANDGVRREQLEARVVEALSSTHTSRLMQSPLQVTIISLLAERMGRLPQDRWKLFSEYFRTIYDREIERNIETSQLLQEHRDTITRIHWEVGFQLQMSAERTGSTDSHMPSERFARLVRHHLSGPIVGFDGAELSKLTDAILRAALERLVFLVSPEGDRVGFEIRSLQEFAAAERLADGRDSEVHLRLQNIGLSSHWRNTLRFLGGNLAANKPHLIDQVRMLVHDSNDKEELLRYVRAGSRIALDLVEDGLGSQQPVWGRDLVKTALELSAVPSDYRARSEYGVRLGAIYHERYEKLFVEAIQSGAKENPVQIEMPLWGLLIGLADRGYSWAIDLLTKFWPLGRDIEGQLLESLSWTWRQSSWTIERLASCLPKMSPLQLLGGVVYSGDGLHDGVSLLASHAQDKPYIQFLVDIRKRAQHRFAYISNSRIRVKLPGGVEKSFPFCPVGERSQDKVHIPDVSVTFHDAWRMLAATEKFCQQPTAENLYAVLLVLKAIRIEEVLEGLHAEVISWPLNACIEAYRSGASLDLLLRSVSEGTLGDYDDWRRAEERWRAGPIGPDELFTQCPEGLPFCKEIGKRGVPRDGIYAFAHEDGVHVMRALLHVLPKAASDVPQWFFRQFEIYVHISLRELGEDFRRTIALPEEESGVWDDPRLAPVCILLGVLFYGVSERWISRMEAYGRGVRTLRAFVFLKNMGDVAPLLKAVTDETCIHPERRGLLPWLRFLAPLVDGCEGIRTLAGHPKLRDLPEILVLRLLDPAMRAEDAVHIASRLAVRILEQREFLDDCVELVTSGRAPESAREAFLRELEARIPSDILSLHGQLTRTVTVELDKRLCGLQDSDVLSRSGLERIS